MPARVRVTVGDEDSGQRLADDLADAFVVGLSVGTGCCELVVEPLRRFDRLVEDVLPRLERWLETAPVREIGVEIDGRSYAMVA